MLEARDTGLKRFQDVYFTMVHSHCQLDQLNKHLVHWGCTHLGMSMRTFLKGLMVGGRDLRDQGLASPSSEEGTIGAVSERNSFREKSGTGAHSFHQSGQGIMVV